MAVIRIIIDIKYDHVYKYDFECIFDMFASLLDTLLQTFIDLFAAVFDGLILNFIQTSSGIIAAIFEGLIDCTIRYICAAIYDTYFPNIIAIFTYVIDIVLKIVCLFVAAIDIQLQQGFIINDKLFEQFAAISIDFIDKLSSSRRCDAMINELLFLLNGSCQFCCINSNNINNNSNRIGFCLISVYVSPQQQTHIAVTTAIIGINLGVTRIGMVALVMARMIKITRFENIFKGVLVTVATRIIEYGLETINSTDNSIDEHGCESSIMATNIVMLIEMYYQYM